MEQNRISDKELQVILDYFKQFQIRLAEMNIDDLILKLKENRLTDKEKAKIDEDFAEVRCAARRQFVPTEEELKELLGKGDHGELTRTVEEFDKNMDQWPLLHKMRSSHKLTPEQIDQIIQVTRDKQWWEMTEAEKKEILGNIPFL
jgi:Spy/CpxP family protein refolding chaperone